MPAAIPPIAVALVDDATGEGYREVDVRCVPSTLRVGEEDDGGADGDEDGDEDEDEQGAAITEAAVRAIEQRAACVACAASSAQPECECECVQHIVVELEVHASEAHRRGAGTAAAAAAAASPPWCVRSARSLSPSFQVTAARVSGLALPASMAGADRGLMVGTGEPPPPDRPQSASRLELRVRGPSRWSGRRPRLSPGPGPEPQELVQQLRDNMEQIGRVVELAGQGEGEGAGEGGVFAVGAGV
ncbi:hypothetical protein KEM52_003047 [Ascosphaera acerosa]|nr:hypothetical protein KEM52_003047 [Ascosphaera acerosa]